MHQSIAHAIVDDIPRRLKCVVDYKDISKNKCIDNFLFISSFKIFKNFTFSLKPKFVSQYHRII